MHTLSLIGVVQLHALAGTHIISLFFFKTKQHKMHEFCYKVSLYILHTLWDRLMPNVW